mmetsp:Transcript_17521/g.40715  ORF Transcript_17521/g.40715 Transcript_17521/m.40715 type:complete len:264 (+) Transcript_17521:381-1172(+)
MICFWQRCCSVALSFYGSICSVMMDVLNRAFRYSCLLSSLVVSKLFSRNPGSDSRQSFDHVIDIFVFCSKLFDNSRSHSQWILWAAAAPSRRVVLQKERPDSFLLGGSESRIREVVFQHGDQIVGLHVPQHEPLIDSTGPDQSRIKSFWVICGHNDNAPGSIHHPVENIEYTREIEFVLGRQAHGSKSSPGGSRLFATIFRRGIASHRRRGRVCLLYRSASHHDCGCCIHHTRVSILTVITMVVGVGLGLLASHAFSKGYEIK